MQSGNDGPVVVVNSLNGPAGTAVAERRERMSKVLRRQVDRLAGTLSALRRRSFPAQRR